MMREFHSYGIWFSVYEALITQLLHYNHTESRTELVGWQVACCGVLVGEILWTIIYPLDFIKSKMQADGLGRQRQYRNMRDVVKETWNARGLYGFYRGLGPALCRAAPVSAGTFLV